MDVARYGYWWHPSMRDVRLEDWQLVSACSVYWIMDIVSYRSHHGDITLPRDYQFVWMDSSDVGATRGEGGTCKPMFINTAAP